MSHVLLGEEEARKERAKLIYNCKSYSFFDTDKLYDRFSIEIGNQIQETIKTSDG